MPTGNIELARQAIDAMNRRDLDWLIAHSAPDLDLHARGVAGEPVLYRGVAGLRANLHDMARSGSRSSTSRRTSARPATAWSRS